MSQIHLYYLREHEKNKIHSRENLFLKKIKKTKLLKFKLMNYENDKLKPNGFRRILKRSKSTSD